MPQNKRTQMSEQTIGFMPGNMRQLAEKAGILAGDKSDRISARVNHQLLENAKRRTGITATTELVEFALASIALEDAFADTFMKARGSVDPDIDLGL